MRKEVIDYWKWNIGLFTFYMIAFVGPIVAISMMFSGLTMSILNIVWVIIFIIISNTQKQKNFYSKSSEKYKLLNIREKKAVFYVHALLCILIGIGLIQIKQYILSTIAFLLILIFYKRDFKSIEKEKPNVVDAQVIEEVQNAAREQDK